MTQQEIGSHLGATREVIARLLRRLVSERYVETRRNLVVITHPSRLAELVKNLEPKSERRKQPNAKLHGMRLTARR